MVHRIENTKPEVFSNVKVYAANPWDPPVNGKIRNLEISNIGK